jgi:hypothetical protein
MGAGLQLPDCDHTDASLLGERLLTPIQEPARRSALCRANHEGDLIETVDSIKSVENRLTIYRF